MQRQTFSLFWHSAMKYPFRTIIAVIGTAATTIASSFVGPFIISQLFDQLQHGGITIDGSIPLILMYAATQIYSQVFGWRLNLFLTWTMETAAQTDLYQRIFSALTAQSLTFHSNRFGGALVSQTTKLVGSFERFWDTIIWQIIPTITSVVAATVILSFFFWQYAAFLLVLSIVFALVVVFGSRFLAKYNKEEAQASTASNAYVADVVTNVMTVKAHGYEKEELNQLTDRTAFWRGKSLANMRGFLTVSTGYSLLLITLNIGTLIAAIWASEHNIISIGTVYLCLSYTLVVGRQLWEINSIMRSYNRVIGDAYDMTEILSLTPSVIDASSKTLKLKKGTIVFENVSFAHPGNDDTLFEDFSLTIKAGERVGLVGHSGSGKTTLTKLLLRFVDIDSGTIKLDNQDISKVTQESLRKNIAYVPQEPLLFHRSLRENISYGKPGASDEEIISAAKQANAMEFIDKLGDGLDTMVGERGVKLSGGQRQRIVIARAILKNAPILLLDEATSALDSESEKLIQDALEKLMKGRTSIVIAHRLSTISKLDRIIVLEDGTIREDGTHATLLKNKGIYTKLWSRQSGGFMED